MPVEKWSIEAHSHTITIDPDTGQYRVLEPGDPAGSVLDTFPTLAAALDYARRGAERLGLPVDADTDTPEPRRGKPAQPGYPENLSALVLAIVGAWGPIGTGDVYRRVAEQFPAVKRPHVANTLNMIAKSGRVQRTDHATYWVG